MATQPARMRQLQATEADWIAADPILLDGEIAFSSDVRRYKVGPGVWSALEYWSDITAPQDGNIYAIQNGTWINAVGYMDYSGNLNAINSIGNINYRLVDPITNGWLGMADHGNHLIHMQWDDDAAVQIGFAWNTIDNTTHVLYQRVKRAGVWGVWTTSSAYNPQPYIGDLNTLASGGTFQITGPLGNGVLNAWPTAGFGDVIVHTNIDSVTAMQVGYELKTAGEPQIWMRTMAVGVWGEWYENKFGFEISEDDIVDLNRMRWRNAWQAGVEYVKNDTVVSSGYLAVANTATLDSPVPQPSGDPTYSLPTDPAWATLSENDSVQYGAKVTVPDGTIYDADQIRFWVPVGAAVAGYSFNVYYVDVTDPDNSDSTLIKSFTGDQLQEGWNAISNSVIPLLTGGTAFILYVQAINSSGTTTWSANWTRGGSQNNAAPPAGQWVSNNNNSEVYISITDMDAGNQAVNLGSVVPGTELNFFDINDGGSNIYQKYTVTLVEDSGTYYTFGVVPLESGPQGAPNAACTLTATIPIPGATDYVSLAGYYATNDNISGIYQIGEQPIVEDENAYGIDLQFIELIASPDWDIAAISGTSLGGTGGGSGGGGGSAVWYSDTVPSDAEVGDLWYKSTAPVGLYVLTDDGNSTQWVQTNGLTVAGDYVERAGDTMTGNLIVPDGAAPAHAVNKGQMDAGDAAVAAYVDSELGSAVSNFLPLSGGTMTGNLFTISHFNLSSGSYLRGRDSAENYRNIIGATSGNLTLGNTEFSSQSFLGDWTSGGKITVGRLEVITNDQNTVDDIKLGGNSVIGAENSLRVTFGKGGSNSTFSVYDKNGTNNEGIQGTDEIVRFHRSDGMTITNVGDRWVQLYRAGPLIIFDCTAGSTESTFYQFRRGTDVKYQINLSGSASGANHILNRADGDARYQTSSSLRYKDNIQDADIDQLASLFDSLTPKHFLWGGELKDNDRRKGHTQYGFVAEELPDERLQIFSLIEDEDGNDTEQEQIEGADPLAICAVLFAKIHKLEAELRTLKGE